MFIKSIGVTKPQSLAEIGTQNFTGVQTLDPALALTGNRRTIRQALAPKLCDSPNFAVSIDMSLNYDSGIQDIKAFVVNVSR